MFVGYEEYVAVAICLFCTWLGYNHGRRNGIEIAVNGMVNPNLIKVLENGDIVAGPNLNNKRIMDKNQPRKELKVIKTHPSL